MNPRPSTDRAALSLAGLLTFTGAAHLVRPHTFDPALPDWLPGSKRAWALGSGVAELLCAALVAVPGTRRFGGRATAALFVAVFPGNVHMATTARTPRARVVTLARLPLQVPLVLWALRAARTVR
ncbi:membrane protein [Microlunatus spumicola]|uniref:Membrane protein n=1 Tax=Microlunatus spumicola TaxID=81499 RepID=A0ABP6XDL8_9ACTN